MTVRVSADLERFAESLVAEGRYGSVEDVVAEGLRLMQAREAATAALRRDLQDAIAEADRDGWLTWDDVERMFVKDDARPPNEP